MNLGRYHNYETFLMHFADRVSVFQVFEALFPKEFTALGVTPISPIGDRVQAYAQLTDLLIEKMPVSFNALDVYPEDEHEMIEDDFIQYFPLDPQGRDYDEVGTDYLSLAERLLLTIGEEGPDKTAAALTKVRVRPGDISPDALQFICSQQIKPLAYLWDSFAIVRSCTGNQWLDISPELYYASEQVKWDIGLVQYLIGEWRDAQPILERANQFNAWLEKDLRRIRKVEKLLQEATRPENRQRIRVVYEPARPLMDTLADFDEGGYDEI